LHLFLIQGGPFFNLLKEKKTACKISSWMGSHESKPDLTGGELTKSVDRSPLRKNLDLWVGVGAEELRGGRKEI